MSTAGPFVVQVFRASEAYKDLTDDQQDEVAEMVLKDTSWKRFMDEWAPSMYDGKDALGVAVEFVEQHLLSFPSWDAVSRDRTKAAIQAGHMKEMVIGAGSVESLPGVSMTNQKRVHDPFILAHV